MLVLSRKLGEEIVIGGNVRVRVVAVNGNQVRLGFTAPADVLIRREELLASGGGVAVRRVPQRAEDAAAAV